MKPKDCISVLKAGLINFGITEWSNIFTIAVFYFIKEIEVYVYLIFNIFITKKYDFLIDN